MPDAITRALTLKDGESFVDVTAQVFWPEERDGSWFTDWSINWPDRHRTGSAGGVDAIQSLICALKMVGTEIYCSAEHQAGLLTWSDDWSGYGFPVPNGIRDMLHGDDATYL